MAGELSLTAAQIAAVYPDKAEIIDMIAAETITAGQAIYITTAGKAGVADANGSGTTQFRGIALAGAAAGGVVPVIKRGHVYGFTVGSTNCGSALYLSNSVGEIATSAGSISAAAVGRVVALTDGDATRVVYVDAIWSLTQA